MSAYTSVLALIFGVGTLISTFVPLGKPRDGGSVVLAAIVKGAVVGVGVFGFNSLILHYHMPPTISPSMWLWVFLDFVFAMVVSFICDAIAGTVTLASALVVIMLLGYVGWGVFKVNTDISHTNEAKAFINQYVRVTPVKDLPDTSTEHMIVVPDQVADSKADTNLGQDYAGQHSVNTYYNPLPVTPLFFQNHFWGLVALTYDGATLKHKMGDRIPGYQIVDLEDKEAHVVQHFGIDPQTHVDYSYKYTIDGGQDEDVVRHVYQNGYSDYGLEGATPEIDEAGHMFFTITLTKPAAGWGYEVPVGMVTVDAASGDIQPYFFSGPKARSIPSWVDRVFSADVVEMLLNYWGNWQGADFCSMNCNGGGRFKVDNHPILAYDKNGDPTWRVLMTSQNSNTSANWVILFDARTGEIRQFTPLGSMPIEESLTGIFESAMGTNGVKIPFQPVGLTFHVIQGEPTWMMTYLATNGKSVAGYGFMQAYSSSPGDVAFGETKDAALDAYSTKLAAPSGSGTVQQGGKVANVSGVITDIQRWDESGQAFAHIKVDTKPGYIFKVQLNSKNAEVGFAHPMDTVVITYNDNGPDKKVVDVRSINVTPVKPAGSLTQALFTEHQTSAILEVGGAVLVVFVLAAAYAIWRRRRNSAVIGDSSDNGPDSPEDLVDAREHLEEITGVDINHDGVVGHNPDTVKENVTADEPANRIVHS